MSARIDLASMSARELADLAEALHMLMDTGPDNLSPCDMGFEIVSSEVTD